MAGSYFRGGEGRVDKPKLQAHILEHCLNGPLCVLEKIGFLWGRGFCKFCSVSEQKGLYRADK